MCCVNQEDEIDGPTRSKVVIFSSPLDETFTCPTCQEVLREPRQTPCGHRFCRRCLETILSDENPRCPVDGEELDAATVFPDICCQRELLDLSCLCLFRERGCSWKGEMRNCQKHQDECPYSDTQCLRCGEDVERRLLEEHKASKCRYRDVECKFCGVDIPLATSEDHLQTCPKVLLQCIVGCGKEGIPRDMMEEHVTEQCPKAEKLCSFRIQGCSFKGNRDILKEHREQSIEDHLDLVNSAGREMKIKSQQTEEKIAQLGSENRQLAQQLSVQNEALAAAKQDLRTHQIKLGIVERNLSEQKKEIAEFRQKLERSANPIQGAEACIAPQMEEMLNLLNIHEKKFIHLERDLAKHRASAQTSSGNDFELKTNMRYGGTERQERSEHQLNRHEIQLSDQNLKMQMLQATSYDGNFIWKIDEYSQRFNDAVSGKTPSIYSAPFYVGKFGYKVCARLYPYGDGMGKGTHISLFFAIMRGEYDALLPWPFRQKVSFRLFDQDGVDDVTNAFRPDVNTATFKKPTSNMNIASGCPLFVSHSALQTRGYIRDNVMFIKVSVETNGLAKL